MKATRFHLLLPCIAICFLVGFSHPDPDNKVKAIWIWQAELISTEKQEILSFSEQHGINRIFLRIDLEQPNEYYRQFIRDATASGIEVHAVGGHPAWARTAYQPRMLKLLEWVKQYNRAAAEAERIKGIQLDIEPYLLPQWEEDRETLLREWQTNVTSFVQAAKQDSDLEVSAALAIWLDDIPVPDQPDMPLSAWMIGQFDSTVLMAYRDTLNGPNGLLAVVENEIRQADELGKRIIVAVNLKKIAEEHASFAEEGVAEMNRVLGMLPEYLDQHPAYAGTAIHDYRHWPKEEAPPAQEPKRVRGTYIWHAEHVITEAEEILQFAKAEGVNLLYARLDLQQPFSAYRRFVREANAAGIEVHAMGGHPVWALEENAYRIKRLVQWVKEYNQSAAEEERFRGVHLDIEPYVMPMWSANKESVLRQWMQNVQTFVQESKDADLQASASFAMWFDHTPTPGQPDLPFNQWMIRQLDHTTLMAFRDHAEGRGGIVDMVSNEIQYADQIGKTIIVAVEMKKSLEADYVSFYEEGKGEMRRQINLAEQHLAPYAAYGGWAVHAYEYWKHAKE
ncbi:hypothetical protein [Brevibacillus marinus]|uniref:hypothetical protein n=1 Tax=Brevibacillus marinus TaxID=2496837 RepID=UPI000F82E4C4|nr:hypothetical protein [Brevibacillus marinus]